jgi:hypothetical protein
MTRPEVRQLQKRGPMIFFVDSIEDVHGSFVLSLHRQLFVGFSCWIKFSMPIHGLADENLRFFPDYRQNLHSPHIFPRKHMNLVMSGSLKPLYPEDILPYDGNGEHQKRTPEGIRCPSSSGTL